MKHLRHITKLFSPNLSFASTAKKNSRVSNDDINEVFEILEEYRRRKLKNVTIFVETSTPLSPENTRALRRQLGAPEKTRVIEHLNPSLGSSFQVVYKGLVYTYIGGNRLERLRTQFVHTL